MQKDRTSRDLRFQIFRGSEALPAVIENFQEMTPVITDGLERVRGAGLTEGQDLRTLFEAPGFSLIYAWFKSYYPLILHSHEADCLYYIIGGSLKFGTEHLCRGDGFFVPANMPYSYVAGDAGVEIIEIRHQHCGDIKFTANTSEYWDRMVGKIKECAKRWKSEQTP